MTEGSRMLWLLLCLLPLACCSTLVTENATHKAHDHEVVAVTMRPLIYHCRSPNMEDFTCWWHPINNLSDGDVNYTFTYSIELGPRHDCPDYVTAGPNSCYFNKSQTSVWKMYCMNVTAVTAQRNYTSQEHCLDVADIVQTEAPVNLTYVLTDAGGDEMGHNVQLSWKYPVPSHLQYGWITLLYELQYRRVNEPDNWKVKHPLHEPHVKLLGLPVGDFVVRVRCRSQNYGVWSKWSPSLALSIPPKLPSGKLLVLILVTSVGVVALLVIAFGLLPQSRSRMKAYFLPPIPKPRIMGIDPLLLKKGHLDEINRHLSNFHSYRPPSYTEEVWDKVSAERVYLATPKVCVVANHSTDRERDSLMVPCDPEPSHQRETLNPATCGQNMSPYCSSPPEAFAPPLAVPSPWPRPEILSLPGTDYSMMGHGDPFAAPDAGAVAGKHSPQDFYTCVQLLNESGDVHLVSCSPLPYCREFPPPQLVGLDAGANQEKKKKLAEYQTWKNTAEKAKGGIKADRSEAAAALLPVAADNIG